MFKGIHVSNRLVAVPGRKSFAVTAVVAATIFASGSVALAQGVPAGTQGSQSIIAHSALASSAAPLSLARAIDLALEGNADVAAAMRQVESEVYQPRS